MAKPPKATSETSPLLNNSNNAHDNEAQAKPKEAETPTTITWTLTAGIGFTWVASFLAAAGR
jgi:hypothetical protein